MPRRSIPLLLLLAAACGSEPSPLTPTQYIQRRADTTCAAISAACLVPAATCVAARQSEYLAEYQAALANVRDFIPATAEACLAKVEEIYGRIEQGAVAMKATDYEAMQAICADVYRGAGAANGGCQTDVDCVSDLICDKGFCGTPKLVPLGAGCANIGEICAPGAFCSNASGIWMCTAKVGVQGDCTVSPCVESLRCAAGLCVSRLDTGLPCATDDDCTSGFCEPYAGLCAADVRFANGSAACAAMSANTLLP